jgi:hypothetical protein
MWDRILKFLFVWDLRSFLHGPEKYCLYERNAGVLRFAQNDNGEMVANDSG